MARKRGRWAWYVLGILFILFIIGTLLDDETSEQISSTNESMVSTPAKKDTSKQLPDFIEVTANNLYSEYEANEVAADRKYKGNTIIVSGEIQKIAKEILGKPYVILGGEGFLDGVQCVFDRNQEGAVAKLSKGQSINIRGKVSGKLGNVLLDNCEIHSFGSN